MENWWLWSIYGIVGFAALFVIFVLIALKIDLDKMQLKKLQGKGVNLRRQQEVVFTLHLPNREVAEEIAKKLGKDEYEVSLPEGESGTRVVCLAKRKIKPDLRRLQMIRQKMYAIARPRGGTYEGWSIEGS